MQYKLAMQRMMRDPADLAEKAVECPLKQEPVDESEIVKVMVASADNILHVATPLCWSFLFVLLMDRDTVIHAIYMPFLGIAAACLANAVPIGGGIVYIPALTLLGTDIHLSAAFTIATMSIGNGVFGFLRWLVRDSSLIVWDTLYCAVLPSWCGSLIAYMLLPPLTVPIIKLLFALLCLMVAVLVAAAAYYGTIEHMLTALSLPSTPPMSHRTSLYVLGVVSFVGGLVLVPAIGIGPALLTFLHLSIMKHSPQAALVTGIAVGGWVCWVPFLYHIVALRDIPYDLWLMVLPGVFYGAKVNYHDIHFINLSQLAPLVHDYIGIRYIHSAFAVLLVSSALLFLLH